MGLRLATAVYCIFLSMSAHAQSSTPKGWFLHDDQAPTLTLAYYDPSSGNVIFAATCTQGYSDTIIAFYPEAALAEGKKSVELALSRSASRLAFDGAAQVYSGRYTIDGQTSMEPELADLLQGGFTLAVDGQEMQVFTATEQDSAHIRKLTEACRG